MIGPPGGPSPLVGLVLPLVLLAALTLAPRSTAQSRTAAGPRMGVLSLDGGSHLQLMDAVRRGVMPRLAGILDRGAHVGGLIPAGPDAATPPSHSSLWTGAPTAVHGITGYSIHLPGSDPSRCSSGFDATQLRAEPVWVAMARGGLDVFLLNVPMSTPMHVFAEGGRFHPGKGSGALRMIQGYGDLRGSEETWVGCLEAGRANLEVLGHPVRLESTPSGTLEVVIGGDRIPLDPTGATVGPLAFGPAPAPRIHLRQIAFDRGSGHYRVWHSAPEGRLSLDPDLDAAFLEATGGFAGMGPRASYRAGRFGPTLSQGGDGSAETAYLDGARFALRQTVKGIRFAAGTGPEVLIAYVTQPDEANHLWTGFLVEGSPLHDPDLAPRYRQYMDRLLGEVDRVIGALVEAVGADGVVVITADHGRFVIRKRVFLNRFLLRKSHLVVSTSGEVDPRGSRVHLPCRNSPFLLARDREIPHDQMVEVATDILSWNDPDDGRPIFLAALPVDAIGREAWFGGVLAGDLFVMPRLGYFLETDAGEGPELTDPTWDLTGHHNNYGGMPSMGAAFFMAGPGVQPRTSVGPRSNLRVAPTLCRILGVPPPAQADKEPLLDLLRKAR